MEMHSEPHYQLGRTAFGHNGLLHWTTNGTTSLCRCHLIDVREATPEDEGRICRLCDIKKQAGAVSPIQERRKWGTNQNPQVTSTARTSFELKASEFDKLATELRELCEAVRIKRERFNQLREEIEKFINSVDVSA